MCQKVKNLEENYMSRKSCPFFEVTIAVYKKVKTSWTYSMIKTWFIWYPIWKFIRKLSLFEIFRPSDSSINAEQIQDFKLKKIRIFCGVFAAPSRRFMHVMRDQSSISMKDSRKTWNENKLLKFCSFAKLLFRLKLQFQNF